MLTSFSGHIEVLNWEQSCDETVKSPLALRSCIRVNNSQVSPKVAEGNAKSHVALISLTQEQLCCGEMLQVQAMLTDLLSTTWWMWCARLQASPASVAGLCEQIYMIFGGCTSGRSGYLYESHTSQKLSCCCRPLRRRASCSDISCMTEQGQRPKMVLDHVYRDLFPGWPQKIC